MRSPGEPANTRKTPDAQKRALLQGEGQPGLPIEGAISSSPNSRHNNEVVMAAAGIFGPRFECHGHHIADAAPD
jgi:hypothetical protein